MLERENVERIFDEQKLAQSADFSTQDAVKLGHMVGANYLIVGRVVHLDKVATNSGEIQIISVGPNSSVGRKVQGSPAVRGIARSQ